VVDRPLRIAVALAATLVALGSAGSAAVAAPSSFFGVAPSDSLRPADFERMHGVVGTLRIPIYWFQVEPRPGEYDFSAVDETVGAAAEAGIRILPFVYGSPAWMTENPAYPPLGGESDRTAWVRLLRALVHRYGPDGEFWRSRPEARPIRRWQLWNEPNFLLFWKPRPSPQGYARLLSIGARAIRREDPHARIVLAAVAPVEAGPLPWVYLRRLYRTPGVKRSFDVVGLHPYASSLRSLEYQIVQARAVMAAAGDRSTPMEVTEFGVASAGSAASPMIKSPMGQAAFLRRSYRYLLKHRRRWRLAGASWFTWRDGARSDPHCSFCQYSGLFALDGTPKPAWWAFRHAAIRGGSRSAPQPQLSSDLGLRMEVWGS
jgi:hypothetical protein